LVWTKKKKLDYLQRADNHENRRSFKITLRGLIAVYHFMSHMSFNMAASQ